MCTIRVLWYFLPCKQNAYLRITEWRTLDMCFMDMLFCKIKKLGCRTLRHMCQWHCLAQCDCCQY